MALRLEIEQLRERLKRMTRPGMAIIAVSLTLLVAGLVYVGWKLSNNVPPSAPAPGAKSVASVSAFCRPCADLSRLETAMQASLAHAGSGGIEAADKTRIVDAIKGWHRRCSTLLCETKTGQAQACSAPPAALLSELAAIDHLSDSLSARTAQCSISGCQTAKCEPAQTAANAFGTLQQELHGLVDHPEGLASERHDVATGFVFDEISNLTDTVLSTPQLVAQGRYAAAEARLLFLRDAALSAGANVPDSAESVLADRMDDLTHSIDALAKAERVGLTGPALAGLWQDFAEASSRLMVETAGLSVRMPARSSAFASLVAPPAASAAEASAAPVCNGALRLVEASATHLNDAMGQLAMCNVRAECHLDDDATSSIQRPANAGSALEILASERQAATDALSALAYAREQDVDLKTDLAQYWAHEAIQVTPLSDTNRCLMDRGSRLVLGSEGANGDVTPVEAHPLDPSDNAAWLFEAPKPPGRYRFVLLAPKTRGAGVFGASQSFDVAAAPTGCSGFAGTWQTDFGLLTVNVRDGVARGSYRQAGDDRAGILEATIDGPILVGRWYSELGTGGTRLTLSEDGQSFSGTWSQTIERTGGAGKWEGHCINQSSGALAPAGSTASVPPAAAAPAH